MVYLWILGVLGKPRFKQLILGGLLLALVGIVFGTGMIVGVVLRATQSVKVVPALTPVSKTCYDQEITPAEIIRLTNKERAAAGLAALTESIELDVAATSKTSDMKLRHYWAHVSPIGTPPWTWIKAAGYNYATAGENLAEEFVAPAAVMAGWMNSPEHRENILNTSYTDIGVEVGCGNFNGNETTVVTAEYGSRQ